MEAHNGSAYILALIYPKVTLSLVIGAPHLSRPARRIIKPAEAG